MRSKKLVNLVVSIPFIVMVAGIGISALYLQYNMHSAVTEQLRSSTMIIELKKESAKKRVNYIITFIEHMKKKYPNDIQRQKKETLDFINSFQDKGNYISVYGEVMQGGSQSLAKLLGKPGQVHLKPKEFQKKIVKQIKESGNFFVNDLYNKPGSEEAVKKTSYFKYYKGFDWIIATGVYDGDMQKKFTAKKMQLQDEIEKKVFTNILILVFLLIPFIIAMYALMIKIKEKLHSKNAKLHFDNSVFAMTNALQTNIVKLHSLKDQEKIFYTLLKKLEADRLYIFKNDTLGDKTVTSQIFEVTTDNATCQKDNPYLENACYEKLGLHRWLDRFNSNKNIQGDIKNFPESEKKILQPRHIKSILVIPIFYNKKLWGFIGLDACAKERKWTSVDKFVLHAIANAYLSVLMHEEHKNTLEQKIKEELDKSKEKDEILMHHAKLAAMGEMIGNIAHQWRQPINNLSILNMTLVQEYENNTLDRAFMEEFEDKANTLIQKMSATIDDFKNFFSPNRSKELFFPRDAIEETLEITDAAMKNNNIEVFVVHSAKTQIKSYKNELQQVVLNLITNAKDALVAHTIKNKKIEIKTYEDEKNLYIEVSDNGGGIKKDILPKLFEPYFTTKFQDQGTGIGLYMSKVIIQQHLHGTIDIFNYNDGAKAAITVPKETT
ncbi:MAG: ATP-binding protein [Campylobacterota bacterium]